MLIGENVPNSNHENTKYRKHEKKDKIVDTSIFKKGFVALTEKIVATINKMSLVNKKSADNQKFST